MWMLVWYSLSIIGIGGLFAGAVIGSLQRRRELFLFAFPYAVSQCYMTVVSQFEGQLPGRASLVPAWIFVSVQIALIGYIAYRARRARLAVLALTASSLSYTWFAYFVGMMAFSDTWL